MTNRDNILLCLYQWAATSWSGRLDSIDDNCITNLLAEVDWSRMPAAKVIEIVDFVIGQCDVRSKARMSGVANEERECLRRVLADMKTDGHEVIDIDEVQHSKNEIEVAREARNAKVRTATKERVLDFAESLGTRAHRLCPMFGAEVGFSHEQRCRFERGHAGECSFDLASRPAFDFDFKICRAHDKDGTRCKFPEGHERDCSFEPVDPDEVRAFFAGLAFDDESTCGRCTKTIAGGQCAYMKGHAGDCDKEGRF